MIKSFSMTIDWRCEEADAPAVAEIIAEAVKKTIANCKNVNIDDLDDKAEVECNACGKVISEGCECYKMSNDIGV